MRQFESESHEWPDATLESIHSCSVKYDLFGFRRGLGELFWWLVQF